MYNYFEVMFTVLIKRKNNLSLNSHLVEHWTCKSFSSTRFSEKKFPCNYQQGTISKCSAIDDESSDYSGITQFNVQ